ncbi:SMI1/KNR4 family protein [uncultured Tenacibaculum sp.]|uniref:SMI1/KNR4 family protein n=1 Tax=uncultured Tenacibaculum sp. TaxID=174713 RepID=UPI0026360214|nr:SMI1/KNR4 family protein [uncultured Tenacibaculum sp.]
MDIHINNDEPEASPKKIEELESLLGTSLPNEYRSFLQKHNGCTIYPDVPTIEADTNMGVWAVERFLSVEDLIMQKQTKVMYSDNEYIKEYDGEKYPINIEKLLTIAIAERGCYHIYLGNEEKGQIYATCYSDGDGLVKFDTNSFNDFIDSLSFYDFGDDEIEEYSPPKLERSSKVFDYFLFDTVQNPELGFQRFKEVLKEYGDPNFPKDDGYKNVVETYVHNHRFLKHILSQGGKTEGLLNSCNNYETIQLLISEYNEDINKPYKGRFPIHNYATATSMHDHKVGYELIDKILKSKIHINLSVTDSNGVDIKTKLIKLNKGYNDYIDYDKKRGNYNPEDWIFSEEIEKIINGSNHKGWLGKLFKK